EPLSRLRVVGRRPASVEPCVAVLHPPELLKSLPECGEERRSFQVVLGIAHQYADPPHALGLLCACGSRPCRRRAAEKCDEVAPFHCPDVSLASGREDNTPLHGRRLLHCGNSIQLMSQLGQNPRLPQRSITVRFTSM